MDEDGMRILVVEDDTAMRALLRDVLERAGHHVIALDSGGDLPVLVEREPIDLLVLDKELPGPNGLDLLAFLHHRLPARPVVLITAFGGPDLAAEALRRGAWRYMEKPFPVSALVALVAEATRDAVGAEPES